MPPLLAHAYATAGGAPLRDLVIASLVAADLLVLLGVVAVLHRSGRPWLERLAGAAARLQLGAPREVGLVGITVLVSLLAAFVGYYVDVATHIDHGRDPGPFANPAHYPILAGLFGIFLAGALGVILGSDPRRYASLRITRTWHAPVGSVLLLGCGAVGLAAFPLDDIWHRLFGQDVTAWGPTHVLMIGAATLAPLAWWLLDLQGRRTLDASARASLPVARRRMIRGLEVFTAGGLLTSASSLQSEFDFGAPQFRLLCQPVLIALVAALVLTIARLRLGRGGALWAVGVWLVLRASVSLIVGPLLGHPLPHFPPYVVEGLAVEVAALTVGMRRPVRYALVAGGLIGTAGVLSELAFSHVWMVLPWPPSLLASAIPLATVVAIGGATLGMWIAVRLDAGEQAVAFDPRRPTRGAVGARTALAALAVVVAGVAWPIHMSHAPVRAHVDVVRPTASTATLRIVLDPPTAADGAAWLTLTAWQGEGFVVDRLRRSADGSWHTTRPVPIGGSWKTMVRLQRGDTLNALPISLPADPAIPAPAVLAPAHFDRAFVADARVLRREERPGIGWLRRIGYLVLAGIGAGWIALTAWAFQRAGRGPAAAPSGRSGPDHVDIAIIGAGLSGIGIASRLRAQGFHDLRIFERSDGVGGTWRANRYPGCACDVPSRLYSYSFAPRPTWTRHYAPQPEILDYVERCADAFGLRDRITTGATLSDATWEEAAGRWHLSFDDGSHCTARVMVSAIGGLSRPAYPNIEGLDSFPGRVMHTAEWDPDAQLAGTRVAVIGTGASAIQVAPELQPAVRHLSVFQRSAPWVIPRFDRAVSERTQRRYARWPWTQRLLRAGTYATLESIALGLTRAPWMLRPLEQLGRRNIRRGIADPQLRAAVTPDYRIGCKRTLISNDWYPALAAGNVDLVTSPIARISERGVVTADGVEHEVDTIILGTGFRPTETLTPLSVRGRSGADINEAWADGLAAYRGTTVSDLPNFFILMGPNTGLGHNSQLYMIESQFRYVVSALTQMRDSGLHAIAPRADAQRDYNRRIQRRLRHSVWVTGGCSSWYLDRNGRNTTLWPGFSFGFRAATRHCDLADFAIIPPPQGTPVAPRPARSEQPV